MSIKSINGLAWASIKSRNGLAIASVKSINGLTVPAAGGIGNVASVTATIVYDAGNWPADNSGHEYRVYAYDGVNYSAIPAYAAVIDNGTYDQDNDAPKYKISVSWSAVSGATGYRIVGKYVLGNWFYYTDGFEWTKHIDVVAPTVTLEDTDYPLWQAGGL
jgi:hypothetical protein